MKWLDFSNETYGKMKILSIKSHPQDFFHSVSKLFEEVREKTFSNPQSVQWW